MANSGLVGTLPYGLWQGNNKQKACTSFGLERERERENYDQFIIKMARDIRDISNYTTFG